MGEWSFDPVAVAAGAVALALFGQGFVRLRRRNPRNAPAGRGVLFTAGVLVGVLAIVSPIDSVGEDELLTVHMLQHLLLGDVMPLVVLAALRGPLLVFLLPRGALKTILRSRPLHGLGRWLSRPKVAFLLWIAAVAGWHMPAVYDAALGHPVVHVLEHVCFVVTGFLVWSVILDPSRRRRLSPGARSAFAFLCLVAGMGVSEYLLASSGPVYGWYVHVAHRPFGWTAQDDQTRAALLMMAEQIVTLGSAFGVLLWKQIEHAERELEEMHEEQRRPSGPRPTPA